VSVIEKMRSVVYILLLCTVGKGGAVIVKDVETNDTSKMLLDADPIGLERSTSVEEVKKILNRASSSKNQGHSKSHCKVHKNEK
jgi:hypothetical protein